MPDVPTLSPAWLDLAQRIARFDLNCARTDDVRPESRSFLLRVVEREMRRRGEPVPDRWEDALAQQCGWSGDDELGTDLADAKLAEEGEVFSREDDA